MNFLKRLFKKKEAVTTSIPEKRTLKTIINKYLTPDRDLTYIGDKRKYLVDMISELSEFTGLPVATIERADRYCVGYADYGKKLMYYLEDELKDIENYEFICDHLGLPIIKQLK